MNSPADRFFARIEFEIGSRHALDGRVLTLAKRAAKLCAAGEAVKAHAALRDLNLAPVQRVRVLFADLPTAEKLEDLLVDYRYLANGTKQRAIEEQFAALGLRLNEFDDLLPVR